MEARKGFLVSVKDKDYFLVSDRKNVTDSIAEEFMQKIGIKQTSKTEVTNFKRRIRKAILSKKGVGLREYWEICGENFGGFGSFVDDGDTIIF